MRRHATRPMLTMLTNALLAAGLAVSLSATPGAASSSAGAVDADADQVTWSDQVAPILYHSCVKCHRPGQTAPMSLMSYAEARPWAKAIRKVTHDRIMPPWFANPAHGHFVEDPRLSDEQIALLARWVDAGAPAGDLSQAPKPPSFDSDWEIGTPDIVFTAEPFRVTDEMEDHYARLEVESHLEEDRWIKAVEVHPTLRSAVHHLLTYLGPPDATAESSQGVGVYDLDFVSVYGPGMRPMVYPAGYGMLMRAHSKLILEIHYHKNPGPGTGGIDQPSVGMVFSNRKPENRMATMWVMDPALDIPPGEANYASASSFRAEHDALIFDFMPHMHLRGKSMRFTAEYPDGHRDVLLDVVNYDTNWQLEYTPTQPIRIPAGTRIAVNAVFDNSADNPLNPDPTVNVYTGQKTTDEMMIGFVHYSFVDKTLQDDMPTISVPESMQEQFDRLQDNLREFHRKLKKAKAADTSTSGGGP